MFENIIVPTDGSEQDEFILPYIEKLGITFNSVINIIVISANRDNTKIHLLQRYMAEITTGLAGKGLKATSTFLPGDPEEEIINFTNNNPDALLSIASNGGSGTSHWSLGDLTAKLITRTLSPILLVPVVPDKQHPINSKEPEFLRIVVPLDGSPLGAAALPYAIEIARKTGSNLFLVNAITSAYRSYGAVKYAADFEKQLIETLRKEAQDYFTAITPDLEKEEISFKADIVSGSPSESILRYAEDNHADLIAISTHGRSGLKRFIMGSVAQQVVHDSDIPVLVVKSN
jgi:nucleotide-binding universal stress UspA family protein